jgi:hypothetical protein
MPSLVDHVLMRFDAFRMEVIEIRWAGPLGLPKGPAHVRIFFLQICSALPIQDINMCAPIYWRCESSYLE